ncbi:MAG: FHA domain-containing protein [Hyphomicrobiaceae bacterium]|nr:FHA domain-containing protein [Hyphomicrobiaceae bacterium]
MSHTEGGSSKDGDEKTRIVQRPDQVSMTDPGNAPGKPAGGGVAGTAKMPGGSGKVVGVAGAAQGVRLPGFAGATQQMSPSEGAAPPPPIAGASAGASGGGGGQVTQLVLHGSSDSGADKTDPVVGWLVVMKGPGRGKFRPVFYGQNSIGRAPNQRISIDFGDGGISREDHAFIIYDEVQRKFFVKDNGKRNIVRCNGAPVMIPTELKTGDQLSIGETTLRFVPFCGPDFDWLDETGKNAT